MFKKIGTGEISEAVEGVHEMSAMAYNKEEDATYLLRMNEEAYELVVS